jgi:hypothetical protein
MLFFIENEFIDVVREIGYEDVFTFCASSPEVLSAIAQKSGTMGEPVELHNQHHNWALHIPTNASIELIEKVKWSDIETVDRLTPPPLAYAFDYVLTSTMQAHEETGSTLWGDYGYCWPEEIEQTRNRLMNCEDPVDGDLCFVPIWTLPNELTGAPREPIIIDDESDFED